MEFLNLVLGVPLGFVMYLCYAAAGDYGLSIILFTLLTKVILFPLSLISQKNSIKMVKMQPLLEDIKLRNEGNSELIMQEQRRLYKEEKYSTITGILPLLLQIPIILGLINVVYNPLSHLLRLRPEEIRVLGERAAELLSVSSPGQLAIIEAVQGNAGAFASLPGMADAVGKIQGIDLMFFGLNLSAVPSLAGIGVLIPLLSGLSALLLSAVQNRANVLQREQGFVGKWGMAVFLTLFSGYFAFIVPGGIGLYWIAGNLLSVLVTYVCNWIYDPKKYIDYENRPRKAKLTPEEKREVREQRKICRRREREDGRRFFSVKKQLVFYSEGSGFYKYFARLIGDILENSDLTVHYVTGDPNDKIFQNEDPRIEKYYIGPRALIPFMMKMDAHMVVMTMPDLDRYHVKRSIVKKDVEYVYMDHGMSSLHLTLREHALDHFDTIFCNGPNHITEIRQTEEAYGLPPKRLVKVGYGLLDTLLENVAAMEDTENETPHILIAPSWQKDNLMDYCLDGVLSAVLHRGCKVILRPHPEYVKRFPGKLRLIESRYEKELGEDFSLETDFSSNFTVYSADVVITDWSTIAHEFSYATKKPSVFINTPMKVMNPEYKRIAAVPLDISLRDEIGISVDVDRLDTLGDRIDSLLENRDAYRKQISRVMEEYLYNIGGSARAGGAYIIENLEKRKKADEKAEREYQALLRGIDPAFLEDEDGENKRDAESGEAETVEKESGVPAGGQPG